MNINSNSSSISNENIGNGNESILTSENLSNDDNDVVDDLSTILNNNNDNNSIDNIDNIDNNSIDNFINNMNDNDNSLNINNNNNNNNNDSILPLLVKQQPQTETTTPLLSENTTTSATTTAVTTTTTSNDTSHLRKKDGGVNLADYQEQSAINNIREIASRLSTDFANEELTQPANLSLFIGQLLNLYEQYLGRNVSTILIEYIYLLIYKNLKYNNNNNNTQALNRPKYTKLPLKLFKDYTSTGSLYHLLHIVITFKNTHGWKLSDIQSSTTNSKNIELIAYIESELLKLGILKPPKVYLVENLKDRISLKDMVLRHGGSVVESEDDATHIIDCDGQTAVPNESEDEYLRTIEHNSNNMNLVHFWYYPDSYDTWVPSSEVEGEDPDPEEPRATWRINSRWITDSDLFNEWMNEIDYEREDDDDEDIGDDDDTTTTATSTSSTTTTTTTSTTNENITATTSTSNTSTTNNNNSTKTTILTDEDNDDIMDEDEDDLELNKSETPSRLPLTRLSKSNSPLKASPKLQESTISDDHLNESNKRTMNTDKQQNQQNSSSSPAFKKQKRDIVESDESPSPLITTSELKSPSSLSSGSVNRSFTVPTPPPSKPLPNVTSPVVSAPYITVSTPIKASMSPSSQMVYNPSTPQPVSASVMKAPLSFQMTPSSNRPSSRSSNTRNSASKEIAQPTVIPLVVTNISHLPNEEYDELFNISTSPVATPPGDHNGVESSQQPKLEVLCKWFNQEEIHDIEVNQMSSFFNDSEPGRTMTVYKKYRDYMINEYRTNPYRYLSMTMVVRGLQVDAAALMRVHSFLEHWNLINYFTNPEGNVCVPLPNPTLSDQMQPIIQHYQDIAVKEKESELQQIKDKQEKKASRRAAAKKKNNEDIMELDEQQQEEEKEKEKDQEKEEQEQEQLDNNENNGMEIEEEDKEEDREEDKESVIHTAEQIVKEVVDEVLYQVEKEIESKTDKEEEEEKEKIEKEEVEEKSNESVDNSTITTNNKIDNESLKNDDDEIMKEIESNIDVNNQIEKENREGKEQDLVEEGAVVSKSEEFLYSNTNTAIEEPQQEQQQQQQQSLSVLEPINETESKDTATTDASVLDNIGLQENQDSTTAEKQDSSDKIETSFESEKPVVGSSNTSIEVDMNETEIKKQEIQSDINDVPPPPPTDIVVDSNPDTLNIPNVNPIDSMPVETSMPDTSVDNQHPNEPSQEQQQQQQQGQQRQSNTIETTEIESTAINTIQEEEKKITEEINSSTNNKIVEDIIAPVEVKQQDSDDNNNVDNSVENNSITLDPTSTSTENIADNSNVSESNKPTDQTENVTSLYIPEVDNSVSTITVNKNSDDIEDEKMEIEPMDFDNSFNSKPSEDTIEVAPPQTSTDSSNQKQDHQVMEIEEASASSSSSNSSQMNIQTLVSSTPTNIVEYVQAQAKSQAQESSIPSQDVVQVVNDDEKEDGELGSSDPIEPPQTKVNSPSPPPPPVEQQQQLAQDEKEDGEVDDEEETRREKEKRVSFGRHVEEDDNAEEMVRENEYDDDKSKDTMMSDSKEIDAKQVDHEMKEVNNNDNNNQMENGTDESTEIIIHHGDHDEQINEETNEESSTAAAKDDKEKDKEKEQAAVEQPEVIIKQTFNVFPKKKNVFGQPQPLVIHRCSHCHKQCSELRYFLVNKPVFNEGSQLPNETTQMELCVNCYNNGDYPVYCQSSDFTRYEQNVALDLPEEWSDQEILKLLEGIERFGDNWTDIAEFVTTKTREQCLLYFLRLPIEDAYLEDCDNHLVNKTNNNNNLDKSSSDDDDDEDNEKNVHEQQDQDLMEVGERDQQDEMDAEIAEFEMISKPLVSNGSINTFSESQNPLMSLLALLSSTMSPSLASAAAKAAFDFIGEEKNNPRDSLLASTTEEVILTPLNHEVSKKNIQEASNAALLAASEKAKILSKIEERQIKSLMLKMINVQTKKLEMKLKYYTELEDSIEKERVSLEKAKHNLFDNIDRHLQSFSTTPNPSTSTSATPAPTTPTTTSVNSTQNPTTTTTTTTSTSPNVNVPITTTMV
ncbi:myb domain-containing protein [Heterostelium album PN500]|uniref:Myb domain-containing protein n=1 Tax=Heterostelium pallidum (strain ATCC 26659 / Pp 5 / PN500) TaxID=670386 RepID=D3BV09_HETP5|nr:myb domain-containing protein [Heterostelium album PN500]EFA74947.1 myb domain-containing protein [Heterostelium album PN500]|eukprot:XP_020427081.1 myb domain-containing protein [Heterostelium album PN500]